MRPLIRIKIHRYFFFVFFASLSSAAPVNYGNVIFAARNLSYSFVQASSFVGFAPRDSDFFLMKYLVQDDMPVTPRHFVGFKRVGNTLLISVYETTETEEGALYITLHSYSITLDEKRNVLVIGSPEFYEQSTDGSPADWIRTTAPVIFNPAPIAIELLRLASREGNLSLVPPLSSVLSGLYNEIESFKYDQIVIFGESVKTRRFFNTQLGDMSVFFIQTKKEGLSLESMRLANDPEFHITGLVANDVPETLETLIRRSVRDQNREELMRFGSILVILPVVIFIAYILYW